MSKLLVNELTYDDVEYVREYKALKPMEAFKSSIRGRSGTQFYLTEFGKSLTDKELLCLADVSPMHLFGYDRSPLALTIYTD